MMGAPLTGTSRGQRLQGDASLTYRLTTQTLDAAFIAIQNLDKVYFPGLHSLS